MFGNLSFNYGTFFGGEKTAVGFNRGRIEITPQISVEPSFSTNWVDLPAESFITQVVSSRMTYTMTPLMFAGALLQYNSSNNAVSSNARLRWEYQPGSEVFIVYSEERNADTSHFPVLQNRAFVVKVNRLLRF